jgi:O-antigen/teichoic acid export membrane protein
MKKESTGNTIKSDGKVTSGKDSLNSTSQTGTITLPQDSFNFKRFSRDALIYAFGQGILLVFGFIQTLLIPKYLSIQSYGFWQIFLLYASYAGLVHLGFVDGILVRWAGKDIVEIGGEIKTAFKFLMLELITIIFPIGLLFYFFIRPPVQWIGILILAYAFIMCLEAFFIFTCQAIRKFKLLTLMNISLGGCFLLFVILLKSSGNLDYLQIILAYITTYLLILLILAFYFRKYLRAKNANTSSLWTFGKTNINVGIFVLLGNFITVIIFTTDRLLISSLFSVEQFAIYAFALTIAMVGYLFVSAIAQVLFPYLKSAVPEIRNKVYYLGKPTIILLWALILALYFPISKIIELYLPNYVSSLPTIRILLCTVGFGSLIQILHANYYKAYGKQRQYFFFGIASLVISIILNLLVIKIWGTIESVAVAMLITFGLWYIVNELSLKSTVGENSRGLWKRLAIIVSYLGAFWLSSFIASGFIVQMLIYLCLFSLITWLLLRHKIVEVLKIINYYRCRQP